MRRHPGSGSEIGGIPELIDDNNGLTFAPGDSKALAAAIDAAVYGPWNHEQIRRDAISRFNLKTYYARLLSIYKIHTVNSLSNYKNKKYVFRNSRSRQSSGGKTRWRLTYILPLECPFTDELRIDQSVSHNGVCLPVVALYTPATAHTLSQPYRGHSNEAISATFGKATW